MKDRRTFLRTIAATVVALGLVVVPALAEELAGFITKVDTAKKELTVSTKKEGEKTIKTTDTTERVTKKGTEPLNLEKLEKQVSKSIDAGKKGVFARITHENGVASKITSVAKKKANN